MCDKLLLTNKGGGGGRKAFLLSIQLIIGGEIIFLRQPSPPFHPWRIICITALHHTAAMTHPEVMTLKDLVDRLAILSL